MTYLVVNRWREFQHYDPAKRNIVWVKNHLSLLTNDAYLGLSARACALLHRIWLGNGATNMQLSCSRRALGMQLRMRVYYSDLKALEQAGFITIPASNQLAETPPSASTEEKREKHKTVPSPLPLPEATTTYELHDATDTDTETARFDKNGKWADAVQPLELDVMAMLQRKRETR